MKRIAVIAVVGLLLLISTTWSAQVTNVEISYQDGSTVARIDVEGPVRFTHETEVPKNGRPDRVIVDVLSANHDLGAKEFDQLPACVVTGVRTSQYAVTPEKIVLIVFDLASAPLYRVVSDDGSITVFFEQRGAGSFETWSSSAVVAAARAKEKPALAVKPPAVSRPASEPQNAASRSRTQTVARQNQAIENDRQVSLAGKGASPHQAITAPSPEAGKSPAVKKEKPPLKTSDRRFSARTFSDESVPLGAAAKPAAASDDNPVSPPARKTAPKAALKPDVTKTAPKPLETSVKATEAKAGLPVPQDQPKAKLATTQPEPGPAKPAARKVAEAPQPAVRKKPVAKKGTVESTDAGKTTPAQGQQALAKKVASTPSSKPAARSQRATAEVVKDTGAKPPADDKRRSTARFRRKVPSAKIRGTMVAEFPKRLVIKYKTGGRRDPFGSLIDDRRTYNDPIQTRIPNVEGLKLVGIIDSDGGGNRALFEDKAGFSYILKSGDKVRNGYVLRVETDQVYFQIFEYGWSRTVALTME